MLVMRACLVVGAAHAADQGAHHHAKGQYDTDTAVYTVIAGGDLIAVGERFEIPVETLAFTRALNVYNNSFRGASAYAIRKGFLSIGAEDNTVVVFPELMDAKSLFLTANADTVYYLAIVDPAKGPMVIEQPPNSLGTINDMWFSWIVDIGRPGPDRGDGGRYPIVPPGYDGPLPEGGFCVAKSRTTRVLYAARSFLVDNDPKPAVEATADGSTTIFVAPTQPEDVARSNWIQTDPNKGWFTILRLYSTLETFFTKEWRPSEIALVK